MAEYIEKAMMRTLAHPVDTVDYYLLIKEVHSVFKF